MKCAGENELEPQFPNCSGGYESYKWLFEGKKKKGITWSYLLIGTELNSNRFNERKRSKQAKKEQQRKRQADSDRDERWRDGQIGRQIDSVCLQREEGRERASLAYATAKFRGQVGLHPETRSAIPERGPSSSLSVALLFAEATVFGARLFRNGSHGEQITRTISNSSQQPS